MSHRQNQSHKPQATSTAINAPKGKCGFHLNMYKIRQRAMAQESQSNRTALLTDHGSAAHCSA
jgi:hypothetical protein